MLNCSYCERECEKDDHIHRFTTNGTPIRGTKKEECAYIICDKCAKYELCMSCGYQCGDIICTYCRMDHYD